MKIKKSELLTLIKEEIVSEMDDFMLDDEYSFELPPEGAVGADTREEMKQTDQIIGMAYSLAGGGEAAKRLLQKCIGLIDNYEEARLSQFDDDDMMQEGLEGINPENMQIVMDALQKLLFSPYTGPMIATAFAAVGVQSVREMFGKRGGDE